MTLANLNTKETKIIKRLIGDKNFNSRLMSLGFFAGNTISIFHKAFGSTLLKVGHSRIALTTSLLQNIEVEDG